MSSFVGLPSVSDESNHSPRQAFYRIAHIAYMCVVVVTVRSSMKPLMVVPVLGYLVPLLLSLLLLSSDTSPSHNQCGSLVVSMRAFALCLGGPGSIDGGVKPNISNW